MDFINLLQNNNFSNITRQIMAGSRPVGSQEKQAKPEPKNEKQTASNVADQTNTYKVVSSSGKEFNRRRKQSSNSFYNMTDHQLLNEYDEADKLGDDKKRKRVLYYIRKRDLKVRQIRRKLNGSE